MHVMVWDIHHLVHRPYFGVKQLFFLSFPAQIPKKGKIYSVNEGNAKNWDGPTAKYVPFMFNILIYIFSIHSAKF